MGRKVISVWLATLLLFGLLVVIDLSIDITPRVGATTWYVDDSGGGDFPTIQAAIDAASPGDTIYVYSGTYVENLIVDKTLTLTGQNRDSTIIEGQDPSRDVVSINANNVHVSGFSIRSSFSYDISGIKLWFVQNCEIYDNNISLGSPEGVGIVLISSAGNSITDNYISNTHGGFSLNWANGNTISGNTISNVVRCITLGESNNNYVLSNSVFSSEYGIEVWHSNGNRIIGNNVSYNDCGICISDSSGLVISSNTMFGDGLHIGGGSLLYWNTHTIDSSNNVNGKPVYYWKNETGGAIPPGAGQVIIANCTQIIIEDQELDNSGVGIELGFSSNNTIINNTISNMGYAGIISFFSINNIINCSLANPVAWDFELHNSHITLINTTFLYSFYCDTISTMTIKWYLHVNVTDFLGQPIPNAVVCIKDNQNSLPAQKYTTDNEGYVRWLTQTEYIEQDMNVKTYYTPHRIMAWNETLMGYVEVNIDESKEVNLVLDTPYREIPLSAGWNLISLPLVQSDTNISTALSSIAGNYDIVQWYNVSDGKWHSTNGDLTDINHTMGFWIHMKTTDTLIMNGTIPNTTSIQLYQGWNLVGNPSFFIHGIDDILSSIATKYKAVQQYDSWDSGDPWKHYHINKPPGFNDLANMTRGRGYWLYVKEDCVWEVSNF